MTRYNRTDTLALHPPERDLMHPPTRTPGHHLRPILGLTLTASLIACAQTQPRPTQVIDISQIGPILTEIGREIALYNDATSTPSSRPAPRTTHTTRHQPNAVAFVLPGAPIAPVGSPAIIPRIADDPSLCPAPSRHFKIRSVTLSIVVSTDRMLTGGIAGTIPIATGIAIGGGPNLTRENTNTETLQYTEYPTQSGPTGMADPSGPNGLAQALIALDRGLSRQNASAGQCFSPTPIRDADSNLFGPDQVTFATNASRSTTGGLTLTLGIMGVNAADTRKQMNTNTITIAFRPT